jgi:SAM-dependent methyltransferase
MIWAMLNDVVQRVITLDKWEQRKNLSKRLNQLDLKPGSKILDFGCGSGLFARVFEKNGFDYWGYDIDKRFIAYASRIYQNCKFTASKQVLRKESPFDLILVNCCLHHIDDQAAALELEELRSILNQDGVLLLIDILFDADCATLPRRMFMKMERGEYIRTVEEYKRRLDEHFIVDTIEIERSHLFSFNHRLNPLYNDLAVLHSSLRQS